MLDLEDSPGFLMQLAVDYLTNKNAQDIVGIGHGQKCEWEVGNNSPYDDLDTKISGTRLSL